MSPTPMPLFALGHVVGHDRRDRVRPAGVSISGGRWMSAGAPAITSSYAAASIAMNSSGRKRSWTSDVTSYWPGGGLDAGQRRRVERARQRRRCLDAVRRADLLPRDGLRRAVEMDEHRPGERADRRRSPSAR